MKKLITLLSLAILVVFAGNVNAQSKRECSVYTIAKPMQKTRGKNAKIKINYEKDKINILPSKVVKKRGKAPACMFTLYNYHNQMVHVYADSVYIGTLRPNAVGTVETVGSYSKLYCVTDDQAFNWEEPGGCSCIHIYHLRIKEGEGQVFE
jgi:hypothetical protein